MYGEWPVLELKPPPPCLLQRLRLESAPTIIMEAVGKLMNQQTSGQQAFITEPADATVALQVVQCGLSLSFSEHAQIINDTLRLCNTWLTCVAHKALPNIPSVFLKNPPQSFADILTNYKLLFTRRSGQSETGLQRQIEKCSEVLRLLITTAKTAKSEHQESLWNEILLFLLGVNKEVLCDDQLPSNRSEVKPAFTESGRNDSKKAGGASRVADYNELQRCVLEYILDVFLHLCAINQSPSMCYWKTLEEQCFVYRFNPLIMERWSFTMVKLSRRLFAVLYPSNKQVQPKADDDNPVLPITDMSTEAMQQCWLRVLHLIRDPAQLSRHRKSYTSFVALMRGLRAVVYVMSGANSEPSAGDPKFWRSRLSVSQKPLINDLHLVFGRWLFDAAAALDSAVSDAPNSAIKSKSNKQLDSSTDRSELFSPSAYDASSSPFNDSSSTVIEPGTPVVGSTGTAGGPRFDELVQQGRAESVMTLSELLQHQAFDEVVHPHIMSAFFALTVHIIQQGDAYLISALLRHSWRIFLQERSANRILLPHLLSACKVCINVAYQAPKRLHPSVSPDEMTSCCIKLLANLLTTAVVTHNPDVCNEETSGGGIREVVESMPVLHAILKCVKPRKNDKNEDDVARSPKEAENIKCCLGVCAILLRLHHQRAGTEEPIVDNTMHVICSLLVGPWRWEHSVCTAALNTLSSLAHFCLLADLHTIGDTIADVCDFIRELLTRDKPKHTRQLHSVVITAFITLQVLICGNVNVLATRDKLLEKVMATIEIGICGIKEKSKWYSPWYTPTSPFADSSFDRPMRAVSDRVHQAAVLLLNAIFTKTSGVGCVSGGSGDSMLSEHTDGGQLDTWYDSSRRLIIHVSRQAHDMVACECTLRCVDPWTSCTHRYRFTVMPRPENMPTPVDWLPYQANKPLNFDLNKNIIAQAPDDLITGGGGKIDQVIATKLAQDGELDEIARNLQSAAQLNKTTADDKPIQPKCIKPHPPSPECDLGRLLLHSLGLLTVNGTNLQRISPSTAEQLLTEASAERLVFTAHLFYVQAHSPSVRASLSNARTLADKDRTFLRFLRALGTIEPGNGGLAKADDTKHGAVTVSCIDGNEASINLASYMNPCALVMPASDSLIGHRLSDPVTSPTSTGPAHTTPVRPPRNAKAPVTGLASLDQNLSDFDSSLTSSVFAREAPGGHAKRAHTADKLKLCIFWLQRHQDADKINLGEYLPATGGCDASCQSLELTTLFVSPLDHQLVATSVSVLGQRPARMSVAPLLDDCVLHVDMLAAVIRHTANTLSTHVLSDTIGSQQRSGSRMTRTEETLSLPDSMSLSSSHSATYSVLIPPDPTISV